MLSRSRTTGSVRSSFIPAIAGKIQAARIHWQVKLQNILRPVAGTAGDLLPRLLVDPVRIFLDRKVLAAPRAAKRYRPSADPEFDLFVADLAVHKNTTPEKIITSPVAGRRTSLAGDPGVTTKATGFPIESFTLHSH
jgi:hypothetical protein